MRIIDFEIENFKGIKSTRIEIDTTSPGNVVTLIGLNESGKTTILEAVSNFVSVDLATTSIVGTVVNQHRAIDLIPKAYETNFTGQTSIKANIELDNQDIAALVEYISVKHEVQLDRDTLPSKFYVKKTYTFEDSDYKSTSNIWSVIYRAKKKRQTKLIDITASQNRNIWESVIAFLHARFPKIVYFPTFMFNIPDRIYLEDHPSWSDDDEVLVINKYFKQVIQDVADSLDSGISLETHIVKRVARHREEIPNPLQFWAALMSMDAASQIKAVTNKLAAKIGRVVFSAWNEISGRDVAGKTIRVNWSIDPEAGNIPYLQLLIHDGEHDYALHERSLGFRWFFTFFLFTQFRASRRSERGTIFLFDEPAANLHARAQTKLLESFGRIATGNKFIMYSTHSHYMIDPMWLEKAFIVENKSVDYEEGDEDFYDVKDTDIRASRYRTFVAQNPKRVSYFQPALDALKFSFGPLLPGRNAVVVEGKFDFHPLRYFQDRYRRTDFSIIPAPSASEAGTLISLLRGLGTNFIVMLDDDPAGRRAAKLYREQHSLGESKIFTLSDAAPSLEGKPFEFLYGPDIHQLAEAMGWENPTKAHFSLMFQELIVKKDFKLSLDRSEQTFRNLFDVLLSRLELPALDDSMKVKARSRLARPLR